MKSPNLRLKRQREPTNANLLFSILTVKPLVPNFPNTVRLERAGIIAKDLRMSSVIFQGAVFVDVAVVDLKVLNVCENNTNTFKKSVENFHDAGKFEKLIY